MASLHSGAAEYPFRGPEMSTGTSNFPPANAIMNLLAINWYCAENPPLIPLFIRMNSFFEQLCWMVDKKPNAVLCWGLLKCSRPCGWFEGMTGDWPWTKEITTTSQTQQSKSFFFLISKEVDDSRRPHIDPHRLDMVNANTFFSSTVVSVPTHAIISKGVIRCEVNTVHWIHDFVRFYVHFPFFTQIISRAFVQRFCTWYRTWCRFAEPCRPACPVLFNPTRAKVGC